MNESFHIVASISPHGYGHALMMATVLNRLRMVAPNFKLTLMTNLPRQFLLARFKGEFTLVETNDDFGLIMRGPMEVLGADTAAAYASIHRQWISKIETASSQLGYLNPDLVISNIGYLILAAAAARNIRSLAFGPFNWAQIYERFCGNVTEASTHLNQMWDAYNSVNRYICTTPFIPDSRLSSFDIVGPIVRLGSSHRQELRRLVRAQEGENIGLLSFGGIPNHFDYSGWGELPGWKFLTYQTPSKHCRANMYVINDSFLSHPDTIASVDVVITKPGYGTIVESVCSGTPIICVEGRDWPETTHLFKWASNNGSLSVISTEALESGDIGTQLSDQVSHGRIIHERPSTGTEEVVDSILAYLSYPPIVGQIEL